MCYTREAPNMSIDKMAMANPAHPLFTVKLILLNPKVFESHDEDLTSLPNCSTVSVNR
jgi:hypothetical protein